MMLAFIYTKNVNNQKVSFYFALKNKDKVPQRPSCAKEWTAFFQTNHIGHDTCNRTHKQSQREVLVSPVLPDDDDTIINKSELHDLAHQLAGSFWQDKQIFKLFNSSDVEKNAFCMFQNIKSCRI